MSKCRSSVSVICLPILNVGFSDVIGSWKIIAMSFPRTSSSSCSASFVESLPSKTTEPSTILAGGFGIRPMIERALPTSAAGLAHDAEVLPSTENETPSAACTAPSR